MSPEKSRKKVKGTGLMPTGPEAVVETTNGEGWGFVIPPEASESFLQAALRSHRLTGEGIKSWNGDPLTNQSNVFQHEAITHLPEEGVESRNSNPLNSPRSLLRRLLSTQNSETTE